MLFRVVRNPALRGEGTSEPEGCRLCPFASK